MHIYIGHHIFAPQASTQLDDALLLELGAGCPRLQRLHLAHCELISERGASCRELRELRLCGCAQLSDDEALQATHGCNALRLLELPSGRMADLPCAGAYAT